MISKFLFPILFIFSLCVTADEITLDWLKDKPRTYAKDFYIWQFLKQDISDQDAIDALGQANNVNNRLFYAYAKKLKHDETTAVVQCLRAKNKKLITTNADCLELGLSVYDITKLNQNDIQIAKDKLKDKYPSKVKVINVISARIPFTRLTSSSTDTFFKVFNNSGSNFRTKNFNYKLPKKTILRLQKDKRFNQTIKLIVTNTKLTKIQESLLHIEDTSLNHLSSFLLAINALKLQQIQISKKFLNSAYDKAYYQFDKDKVLFWNYLVTKDITNLYKLTKSWDVNIYSLYAKEYFRLKNDNIVYSQNSDEIKVFDENKDVSNPFFWIPILNDLKNITEKKMFNFENLLNNKETEPHLTFILERYYNYKKSYFITPYKNHLEKYPANRQALINAIARQESRFIPSSISTAYAMGVMQIMPFLSKAIAKQLHEDYEITDQLTADVNLRYANFHLNFLEKKMKHPLLIAYAYNGGIGFTRKLLKNGLFSKKSNFKEYEPFLSMELLPYNETRKYGKKVLANYYIYSQHLNPNADITLTGLFEKLR